MTLSDDEMREAARILREYKRRIRRLEQARESDGQLSILQQASDTAAVADVAAIGRRDSHSGFVADESLVGGGQAVRLRVNDSVAVSDAVALSQVNTGGSLTADSDAADSSAMVG